MTDEDTHAFQEMLTEFWRRDETAMPLSRRAREHERRNLRYAWDKGREYEREQHED